MKRLLFLRRALRFSVFSFGHLLDQFFGFCTNNLRLFGFDVCCGLHSVLFALSFWFSAKKKIGFSDLLFGVAVWCFSRFSSENMRLNDLDHEHVLLDFACGFQFSSKFISVLRFWIIFCAVLQFLTHSDAALLFSTAMINLLSPKI